MTPSEQIFIEIWNRLSSDWSRLLTFRQMALLGEDTARKAVHRSNEYYVNHKLLNGEHQNFLKDKREFIESGMAARMPSEMTQTSVDAFRQTLDASTLVFAHSILDAAVFDCLQICAIEASAEWGELLGVRKVTLADAKAQPYQALLNNILRDELSRIERESLITKIERVFQLSKPSRQEYLTTGFRFNKARLANLDNTRHQLVHQPTLKWASTNLSADLEFMLDSGMHLFCMVGNEFQLKMSGEEVMQSLSKRYSKDPIAP